MFVQHLRLLARRHLHGRILRIGNGRNAGELRILRINGFSKLAEPAVVAVAPVEPILVPYFHIFQFERRRMSVCDTLGTPVTFRITDDVLDY